MIASAFLHKAAKSQPDSDRSVSRNFAGPPYIEPNRTGTSVFRMDATHEPDTF